MLIAVQTTSRRYSSGQELAFDVTMGCMTARASVSVTDHSISVAVTMGGAAFCVPCYITERGSKQVTVDLRRIVSDAAAASVIMTSMEYSEVVLLIQHAL